MKVSDIFIYIMKIVWRDFKKIRWSRFGDIQESAKSPNSEWSCTYTGGEKTGLVRVNFQDPKNERAPKFPSIKIWYKAAVWRNLRIIWVIYNVFIK